MNRAALLPLLCCLWLSAILPVSWGEETDVDKDPAVQEKLIGLKKRVFTSVQITDLEDKFPASGDTKVRRAAIHKIRTFFPDDAKFQIDCILLELDMDLTEANMAGMTERVAKIRSTYASKLKPEQARRTDYFDACVANSNAKYSSAIELFSKVARSKDSADYLRMLAYRSIAEIHIVQSKPSDAAKILAEGNKELSSDVAPLLDPIKSGVLVMIGQREQAQLIWKRIAENFAENSGPIYNAGLQMSVRPVWTPIASEILEMMSASAKKLPFSKEVDTAVAEAKQKAKSPGNTLFVLGMNQERQGLYEQALATYARAVAANDEARDAASCSRTVLLSDLGKPREALEALRSLRVNSKASTLERADFQKWSTNRTLQESYLPKAENWWPAWENFANKAKLNAPAPKELGLHVWSDDSKRKEASAGMIQSIARVVKISPYHAYDLASMLYKHSNDPEAAAAAFDFACKLEQAIPEELISPRAAVIRFALHAGYTGKVGIDDPRMVSLTDRGMAIPLTADLQEIFPRFALNCAVGSHWSNTEKRLAGRAKLEASLALATGDAVLRRDIRHMLSLFYLTEGKTKESEEVLQQDNAWPLPEQLQKACDAILASKEVTQVDIEELLKEDDAAPKPSSLLTTASDAPPDEAPKAGPYGPALKAALSQVKPPWYDFVSPDSVRDNSIREEKKFLAGEDTSMGLWNRLKGALLYATDTEKSQDTRRSSVILAANCAFLMSRTTGQLESWMPLSLTKSMNDPLNYSVEMNWLQTAVAQGSQAFAERMLQLLKTAASKTQHDSRLDPIVKQYDYFMDLYRLEPEAASVAALKKKIMISPMENDRAQLIAPTMTFLLNHGMKKEAADWRQAALTAVAKDKTDAQNVTKALDNIEKQSSLWRPMHLALSEILWKYVDQSSVSKPREVDEILNQSNVGFEYTPETLRNIYFYYIKKGGLFWQPSHWHRLISDALPNDEKWLPLKRDLCAKAIALAPNDEIRVSFASRYPHYFPLFEEENREQLKSWVAPYRDMKANPIMGHVARWADLNNAFAVMDEAAMKTLGEIPQDTADPIDRHWRTVAALTGRNQAKDVEGMLKNLPEAAFAPYTHQGTMLRALKLIDDQKRLTKVTKDARNNAKALLARVWVNRDLDQLPFLIDLVDALDDKDLLPEPFIRDMRNHPYLPISAPASAWFYTINKSWADVKTAAEIALKTQAGDTFYWPQMNLLLGFAEANLGHKPEAAAALEKFLKQDPSSIHYHDAQMLLEQVKQ